MKARCPILIDSPGSPAEAEKSHCIPQKFISSGRSKHVREQRSGLSSFAATEARVAITGAGEKQMEI
jgi:hypothetical protein